MEKSEEEKARIVRAVMLLISYLVMSIGVGLIFGSGFGFLVLAGFLLYLVYFSKKKEKEEEKNGLQSNTNTDN